MKQADLKAVLLYDGELHEVVAISDGKMLLLRPVKAEPCPRCGSLGDKHLLERSPLFQDHAEPVTTIEGRPRTDG